MRDEIRRLLCGCNRTLALTVTLNETNCQYEEGSIYNLSIQVKGEPQTINFFSKYGKSRKRSIGRQLYVFVFCAECNQRHQVRMFNP